MKNDKNRNADRQIYRTAKTFAFRIYRWKDQRTGYPRLTPGPNPGSTNGQIPRRAIYSSEEAELNAANLKEAAARMTNGDSFLSKVWWDKK